MGSLNQRSQFAAIFKYFLIVLWWTAFLNYYITFICPINCVTFFGTFKLIWLVMPNLRFCAQIWDFQCLSAFLLVLFYNREISIFVLLHVLNALEFSFWKIKCNVSLWPKQHGLFWRPHSGVGVWGRCTHCKAFVEWCCARWWWRRACGGWGFRKPCRRQQVEWSISVELPGSDDDFVLLWTPMSLCFNADAKESLQKILNTFL